MTPVPLHGSKPPGRPVYTGCTLAVVDGTQPSSAEERGKADRRLRRRRSQQLERARSRATRALHRAARDDGLEALEHRRGAPRCRVRARGSPHARAAGRRAARARRADPPALPARGRHRLSRVRGADHRDQRRSSPLRDHEAVEAARPAAGRRSADPHVPARARQRAPGRRAARSRTSSCASTSASSRRSSTSAVARSRRRPSSSRRWAIQLDALTLRDPLTGLYTHRAFQERLREEVARALRYSQPMSLLIADIDGFASVNYDLGYQVGDDILRRIATIARRRTTRRIACAPPTSSRATPARSSCCCCPRPRRPAR